MALFVIYANNLVDDEKEWQATLQSLVRDYKHEVCFVSEHASVIKKHLLVIGFPTVKCIEVKEEFCDAGHIDAAKKLTDYLGKDVIVAAPVLARAEGLMDKQRIVIDGEKTHFRYLQILSKVYRHSNSKGFETIHHLLMNIEGDLRASWPTTPKENLEAQKTFLGRVLKLADDSPNCDMDECLLKVRDQFESEDILTEVITMPANVGILKWGLFRAVLNFNTLTGDLLKKTESRVAEQKEHERSKRAEAEARRIGAVFRRDLAEEEKQMAIETREARAKVEAVKKVLEAEKGRLSPGLSPSGYGSFS